MKKLSFLIILPISCFLGLWGSTQWTAAEMHYSPALGEPLWVTGNTVLYEPWQFLPWYKQFGATYPDMFNKTTVPAFLGIVIGVLSVSLTAMLQQGKKAVATTYGNSRWSTPEEIENAGLVIPPRKGKRNK